MHPLTKRFEAAREWREHLRGRCRPGHGFTSRGIFASDIRNAVCEFYGVTPEALCSRTRNRDTVKPRHVAMWMIRKYLRRSYPWIGRDMGGFDHSSVMHAVSLIDHALESDRDLARDIEQIAAAVDHGW